MILFSEIFVLVGWPGNVHGTRIFVTVPGKRAHFGHIMIFFCIGVCSVTTPKKQFSHSLPTLTLCLREWKHF